MQGYLSADTICSEMRTVFRGESSRKLRALKDRLCPRTNIYMCEQIITLNFVSLTYFWNAGGGGGKGEMFMNSLWFAAWNVYFSVFSGMTLWTNKHVSSSVTTAKLLSILNTFKRIAFILPDIRFQNWVISLGISPRIFSRFSWEGGGIFDHMMSLDYWRASKYTHGLWINLSYDR